MELYKYQGAGNDFLIIDNRNGDVKISPKEVACLCDRRYGVGADGLMLLLSAPGYDFGMAFYNSDGSSGMMCGNGGRCIVAYADSLLRLGMYRFMAPDGPHKAQILSRNGRETCVKLSMRDVDAITYHPDLDGWFLDTGTRHFVKPVDDLGNFEVVPAGRHIRHMPQFGPIGVNVNFAQWDGPVLRVRTYEKGVEDETYACGTGITAAAIAMSARRQKTADQPRETVHVDIQALRDRLAVDFVATETGAKSVFLTGPATYVAKIIVD